MFEHVVGFRCGGRLFYISRQHKINVARQERGSRRRSSGSSGDDDVVGADIADFPTLSLSLAVSFEYIAQGLRLKHSMIRVEEGS